MDGVRTRVQRGFHNPVDEEVALAAGCRTHAHRFVGCEHMGRLRVRFAVHGHGGNAHVARCTHNAYCDFATVGHEEFGDGADV